MNSADLLKLQCENIVLKDDLEKLHVLFKKVRENNIRLIIENRKLKNAETEKKKNQKDPEGSSE